MPANVPNFMSIDSVVVENEADKRGQTDRQTDTHTIKVRWTSHVLNMEG